MTETISGRAMLRVPEAMAVLSLKRSVVYELLRSGRLRSVHEGRTRLIPASAIHAYVRLLEQEAGQAATPLGAAS